MLKWPRYVAASLAALYMLLNIAVALFAVPRTTTQTITEIEGIFDRTFEGGEKDVVIALQDSPQTFYINRGYDNHPAFDVAAFEQQVKRGDRIVLSAYKRWLPKPGNTRAAAVPLAGVRSEERIYLDTAWMAASTVIRDSWVRATVAGVVALLLLLPELLHRSSPRRHGTDAPSAPAN